MKDCKLNRENLRKALRLYLITERSRLKENDLYTATELALKGGVSIVQLREKHLSYRDFLDEALVLKKLCASYGVPFIINDNLEVALASNADGLHIGQGDISAKEARIAIGVSKILGVTAKTLEQAKKAEADGADYLGSGAMFGTLTKPEAVKMSFDEFRSISNSVSIPVLAIGGIDKDNILNLKGLGASGFAVSSAIMAANDVFAASKTLSNLATDLLIQL